MDRNLILAAVCNRATKSWTGSGHYYSFKGLTPCVQGLARVQMRFLPATGSGRWAVGTGRDQKKTRGYAQGKPSLET